MADGDLRSEFTSRLEAAEARNEAAFARLEARFEVVEQRLTARFEVVEQRLTARAQVVEERLASLSEDVTELRTELRTEVRSVRADNKFTRYTIVGTAIASLLARLGGFFALVQLDVAHQANLLAMSQTAMARR